MLNYNAQLQQNNQELEQINSQINNLPEMPDMNGTATEDKVALGKTIYVNGEKITGTIQRTSDELYGREAPTLKFDKTEILLSNDKPFDFLTINTNSGGILSVESLEPTIVKATLNRKNVLVERIGNTNGETAVQVEVEKTNAYHSAIKRINVIVNNVSKILNNNSWDIIKEISDKGQGENYWAVGDTKTININGRVGKTGFNSELDAFILGFNHNADKEGANRIHFLIGKSRQAAFIGEMVGLCDRLYISNYGGTPAGEGYYCMDPNSSTSGGWNACYMRKTILGGDRNPNSPAADTLLAALPADLRAVMKPVTKYTNNIGRDDTANAVTATTDYLFLLAEHEIHGGDRTYANQYEKNSQVQYAFFASGNRKIAYHHNQGFNAVYWWLRSPDYSDSTCFCAVAPDGSTDFGFAYYSMALLAGFAV